MLTYRNAIFIVMTVALMFNQTLFATRDNPSADFLLQPLSPYTARHFCLETGRLSIFKLFIIGHLTTTATTGTRKKNKKRNRAAEDAIEPRRLAWAVTQRSLVPDW